MKPSSKLESQEEGSLAKEHKPSWHPVTDVVFKGYIIVSMTLIWSAHSMLIRFTQISSHKPAYYSTTVVLSSEICKLILSMFLLWRQNHFNWSKTNRVIAVDFFGKPMEILKMSVPSILYALQNNLDFIALANLEPAVYQVTCQLKVVTTAVFMVLMLGRRFSTVRWCSVILLFAGVAMVQLNAMSSGPISAVPEKNSLGAVPLNHTEPAKQQSPFIGLTAVLITCVTAGFSGVYFEKMLKDCGQTSLWVRNMQLYVTGVLSAFLACCIKDGTGILTNGFFYGYYDIVFVIVGLLSVGGIYISMVIKYLDNLLKSFASAASISLVALLSAYIFHTQLDALFALGSFTVISAIILYNYVKD